VYFTASLLVSSLLFFQWTAGALWPLLGLDWPRVTSSLQLWRLSTNFLVLGASMMSTVWQAGLLGCYLGQFQREKRFASARGSVEFLMMLLVGAVLILAVSYFFWPELSFGGPALLFWMLTLFSRMQPEARVCFVHPSLEFSRQWLPLVHVCFLYCCGSNWALASLGAGLAYIAMTVQIRTPLGRWLEKGLPEPLYALGPAMGLGDPAQPLFFAMQRGRGNRLGEANEQPPQQQQQ
jgi:hypothetical protein